jgi:hypothetical protein
MTSKTEEVYSPNPDAAAPTLDELELVRQTALLYMQPANDADKGSAVNMAQILLMSVQGRGEKEIAESLGLSRGQVRVARRALRDRKLLDSALQDAVNRLTNEAVPLAVDETIKAIENGDAKARDRVLDTFGLGPSKAAAGNAAGAPLAPQIPALSLTFNLPPGVSVERANQLPASGKVIGRGKDQPRIEKPRPDDVIDATIDMMPAADGEKPAI